MRSLRLLRNSIRLNNKQHIKAYGLFNQTPLLIRNFGLEDTFGKRERAAEAAYFSKLEREQLKALLNKLETSNSTEHQEAAKDGLLEILEKHKIKESDDLLHDLHVWRYGDESYLKQ